MIPLQQETSHRIAGTTAKNDVAKEGAPQTTKVITTATTTAAPSADRGQFTCRILQG